MLTPLTQTIEDSTEWGNQGIHFCFSHNGKDWQAQSEIGPMAFVEFIKKVATHETRIFSSD
jgi:hypothetical protein